jgi:hypothetical protein
VVAFGNGMFLAGDERDGVGMSTDGISWTSRGGSVYWGGDYPQLRGLTYAAPLFVMTGACGYIATTFDGGNFTTRSTSISGFVESVAYGRHVFVAGGQVDGVSPLMARSEVPAVGIRDHATVPIQI